MGTLNLSNYYMSTLTEYTVDVQMYLHSGADSVTLTDNGNDQSDVTVTLTEKGNNPQWEADFCSIL